MPRTAKKAAARKNAAPAAPEFVLTLADRIGSAAWLVAEDAAPVAAALEAGETEAAFRKLGWAVARAVGIRAGLAPAEDAGRASLRLALFHEMARNVEKAIGREMRGEWNRPGTEAAEFTAGYDSYA